MCLLVLKRCIADMRGYGPIFISQGAVTEASQTSIICSVCLFIQTTYETTAYLPNTRTHHEREQWLVFLLRRLLIIEEEIYTKCCWLKSLSSNLFDYVSNHQVALYCVRLVSISKAKRKNQTLPCKSQQLWKRDMS